MKSFSTKLFAFIEWLELVGTLLVFILFILATVLIWGPFIIIRWLRS